MKTPEFRQKVEIMREQVLDRARNDARRTLDQARKQAEEWREEQLEALQKQIDLIQRNARTRAEEIRLRQIGAARREKNREILRTRSRLIGEATHQLGEALNRLRERDIYPALLKGLLDEAMEEMQDTREIRILLSSVDRPRMEELLVFARERFPQISFREGSEPAPITGGLWLISGDGTRRTAADWETRVQDLMPLLAERLNPLLQEAAGEGPGPS